MIVAILDLGTNTFNLLIKHVHTQEVLFADKLSVKLGEGGIDNNQITPLAFTRGIEALKQHAKNIKKYKVQATYAFATSAVRSATNGNTFVDEAKKQVGILVNVISGNEEATLIYHGVKQALTLSNACSLIVDIGGGSTEFILCNQHNVFWQKSYLLGSSRLKEHFQPSDPIAPSEIEQVNSYFQNTLADLFEAIEQHQPTEIVGSSGSFDTLASMIFEKFEQPNVLLQGATNYTFSLAEYQGISKKMLTSTFEERLNTPGMLPMRADLMPMACLLIDFLLNYIDVNTLKLSTYALKEGVGFLLQKNEHTWLKS